MRDGAVEQGRGYEMLPIPFGWFAVARSEEIVASALATLRYFDSEVVVWRGADGAVRAVDPYCPHLGAHLGSGDVVGDDLRCPFHHWRFDGEGVVTDIPYSTPIPPRLRRSCLPVWPVHEAMGFVYLWYHPRKAAPKWKVAEALEVAEGWVLAERHDWVIGTHVQEITENGQDYAHFHAVHGTQGPPASEFKLEGWTRRNVVETQMTTPRGPMTGKIDALAVGPGQSITRFTDITAVTLVQHTTPVDRATSHLRWDLYHPPGISEGKMRVNTARMRDLVKQLRQDIPIWERKRYVPDPLLVKGDGPVLAYRRQYARFYQFDEPEPTIRAA